MSPVGEGLPYRLRPLPGASLSFVWPVDRIIERGGRISRTTLSDKISRLHPRHVVPKPGQAHEPKGLVKLREGIAPAPIPPDLVLEAQPPAQPHGWPSFRLSCAVPG